MELSGWCNLYEQARHSLNFLQGAVDYRQNATPFFWVKWDDRATWLQHNHWDHSENPGRFLYASVLSRCILGMTDELPVEALFKQQIYDSILPGEALSFRPNPSPYEVSSSARDNAADRVGRRNGEVRYEADMWDNRSVLTGLVLSAVNTRDERAMDTARAMVARVQQLAVWEGDRAWFGELTYPPGYESQPGTKVAGQNMSGWISPLVLFHRVTGEEEALRLAIGLARALVSRYPDPLAETRDPVVPQHFNVHSLNHMVAGVTRVARATLDSSLLSWADEQHDSVIRNLASATGWTPEFLPSDDEDATDSCEVCATADRVDAGIQLALAGHGEYWDDVARCVYNYLDQAQFRDNGWLPVDPARLDDYYSSSVRIRERLVGAYAGWGGVNDLVEPRARVPNSVQNCCGPHGAFAVYQAWHYAVQETDAGIVVNLLVSRDTPWCSVTSGHPGSDIVSIRMKRDGPVLVRLPASAPRDACSAVINGQPVEPVIVGAHVELAVRAGDRIDLTVPQPDHTSTEEINGIPYEFRWRGDFVTGVEPAGKIAPLYHRSVTTGHALTEPEWPPLVEEIEF